MVFKFRHKIKEFSLRKITIQSLQFRYITLIELYNETPNMSSK